MKTNRSRYALAILGATILFAASGQAQQDNGIRSGPDLASASAPAAAAPAGASGEASERERLLLERIDNLERRLALIESGAAPQAPAVPAPEQNQPASAPAQVEKSAKPEPFVFADFTWLTGNSRQKEFPLAGKVFSGEFRVDTAYHYSFNHPKDNTISGSTEVFRHNELQLTDLAFGGDFNWNNVRGRLLTQFGMYSQTQPRNDASPRPWPVQPRQCLPLPRGGVWRLSHRQVERRQRRRRDLSLIHRSLQLLPIRQLGVPAVVCVLQHALVLHGPADSGLPQ